MRTRIKRSHALGEKAQLPLLVQRALLFGSDGEVDSSLLDVSRAFAFSSDNASEFSDWYLRAECLSKYQTPGSSDRRHNAACLKFWDAERVCADSNSRLVDVYNKTGNSSYRSTLLRARALIGSVLGRFDLNEFIELSGFGPGASTSLRRKSSSQQNKWELSTHITAEAIPYYSAFRKWSSVPLPEITQVYGNRVTTVPKSFKTDRIIAIEPDWNMFFQKGIGRMIRRRLQRHDLLTPDAQVLNQNLARHGSLTGSYATLDLSAASDSVSMALCEALLPEDWLRHLMALRSPVGELDGQFVNYEKISSMGNGYTFELETLLFYGLSRAVSEKEPVVRVYGDDIIIHSRYASHLTDVLSFAGFSLNSSKSFWDGPFRESCGGHYFNGQDVTPFYLRRSPETVSDVIVLHNSVLEWHSRQGRNLDEYWGSVVRQCRSIVPKFLWGPWNLQGCLWSDWDESRPMWNRSTQSYSQKVIQRVHRYSDYSERSGSLIYKLWEMNPDLESSILSSACSAETVGKVFLDREAWSLLPVRLA